jgi:hypothetical protein
MKAAAPRRPLPAILVYLDCGRCADLRQTAHSGRRPMPWRQVDVMTERLQFIRDARQWLVTFTRGLH